MYIYMMKSWISTWKKNVSPKFIEGCTWNQFNNNSQGFPSLIVSVTFSVSIGTRALKHPQHKGMWSSKKSMGWRDRSESLSPICVNPVRRITKCHYRWFHIAEFIETVLAEMNVSLPFPQIWKSVSIGTWKIITDSCKSFFPLATQPPFQGHAYLTLSF